MRCTTVQRVSIVGFDWILIGFSKFALENQCVLRAFSMRFQREFDKDKKMGGSVESRIRTPVLLNLLNVLRKKDKMLGKPRILSLFPNLFYKFNTTYMSCIFEWPFYTGFTVFLRAV